MCIIRYKNKINTTPLKNDFSTENNNNKILKKLNDEQENILKFIIDKLTCFGKTYNVDIEIIDDFKITYFIALYFLKSNYDNSLKKLILVILHEIMCDSLISYEPKIMLEKLKTFINNNSVDKFTEEYGDIGYYHTIKAIYLMQKTSAKLLIDENNISDDSIVGKYFKDMD